MESAQTERVITDHTMERGPGEETDADVADESAQTERDFTDQAMEVDQEKETDADVSDQLSIDDFPNEILQMIFRNLDFLHLLRASIVNHRWNELVFFLLRKRVSLRLGAWIFELPESRWTRNRTFTRVSSSSTLGASLDGFDSAAFQSLVDGVQKLELVGEKALDESLVIFLRFFKEIDTLVLKIDKLVRAKTPLWFQRETRGLLPMVRHLTLRCRYVRVAGLLGKVSPKLVTLDLEILPRLVPNFIQCRFDYLESLTLRFKFVTVTRTWDFPGKQGLILHLLQVKTLRKLGFFVDSDSTAFEVALALTAIEELALGGNFKGWPSANFTNLSKMANLRSLTLDMKGDRLSVAGLTTPVPTVEQLRISGSISIPLFTVMAIFPNLKVLAMPAIILNERAILAMNGCSWTNSIEELTILIDSIKPDVIGCFARFRKLKRLHVDCHLDEDDFDLTAFNAIANMDTLKELLIRQLEGTTWWNSAAELGDCNRSCAVFINEKPAKFYGPTRF